MIDSNGIIKIGTVGGETYGVSIGDLQTTFGTSKNDIGAIIAYAASRDSINIWTKYKAERSAKLGVLTLSERQDNYFGIDIPKCTSTTGIASFLSGYASGYGYLSPRGYDSIPSNCEWFRLRDFDGYNPDSNCFVNTNDLTLPTSYTVGAGGVGLYFHVGINNGVNLRTNSIGISDLKLGGSEGTAFGALYFGLLFVNGSTYRLITSANTLATDVNTYGGGEVFIAESNGALTGITTGTTYTVYPVLSLLSHTSMTSVAQQDTIVALPKLSPRSFKAVQMSTQQTVAILDCDASMDWRGRLNVDFVVGMGATGSAPTSMTASYVIYAASGSGDETGEQIASGTITGLTTTQNQEVQRTLITTNPQWIRVYVYNSNNNQVNTQAWAQVSETPLPEEE